MPALARLFVALDLPPAAAAALAGIREPLDGVRWAPPELLHLTLRFIGEVDAAAADRIAASLARVAGAPLRLTLRGAGLLGRPPRLLRVGVEPTPALLALRDAVEAAVVAAGVAPEPRPFRPHVTVARLRAAARFAAGGWAERHRDLAAPPAEVDAFHLKESLRGDGGAIHRRRATYRLGAGIPQGPA